MTWSDFYLLCFIVGFSLSVLSFLAGAVHIHLPFKLHLPFHVANHSSGGLKASAHVPWLNMSTLLAFLAWFGGTGYILATRSHFVALASLGFAMLAGLFAGWLVFRVMLKLMRGGDSELIEADYRVEGSLGSISVPIRENGTGEVIFSLAGVRRGAGARCEDGKPIEKGAEVVIERYEKGIAYVRRWDEFTR